MTPLNFTECIHSYIDKLEKENRFSTAHVYRNTFSSFARFLENENIEWIVFTRDTLRRYEQYLKERGCSLNTISTYMRMLRCIYNIGVENEYVNYTPRLFKEVYTGIVTVKKRALDTKDIKELLNTPTTNKKAKQAQTTAKLMFQLCGIPFVDLAHLKKENIVNNTLHYNRKKTGTSLKFEIDSATQKIIALLKKQGSKYMFPIISGAQQGLYAYKEYQNALRKFNYSLKVLTQKIGINAKVTSYTIRHSFATSLKNQKVPIEMISELLGHTSIKTTQIYLKSFSLSELSKINKANIKLFCR